MGLDNPLHIAFLVVILLLVFGARRLPEIGRSLGTGMREFKDSVTGADKQQATLAPTAHAQQVPGAQPATQPAPPPVQPQAETTAPTGPAPQP